MQNTTARREKINWPLYLMLSVLLCFVPSHAGLAEAYEDDKTPLDVVVAGYSPGGFMSAVGEAIGAMARTEYPGSSLVYEPGNPVGGLVRLSRGERPFALQSWQSLAAGMHGMEPFREKIPPENFRVVARVVRGMVLSLVARKDFLEKYNLETAADIATKKVPVRFATNQRGNLTGQLFAIGVLEAYGLDYETVESFGGTIFHLPSQAAADLLRNDRCDLIASGGFLPGSQVMEMASATEIDMLPIGEPAMRLLTSKYGYETSVTPAGTYDFLEEDLPSPGTGFLLVAGPAATDAQVYKMVRALHRQFDYYKTLHKTFANFSPSMLAESGGYPLHPVAERYYRKAGLLAAAE